MLARNGRIASDGTFGNARPGKNWSQAYCLHVEVEGRFVPAVTAFMGKATASAFFTLFQAIHEWIRVNLGKQWVPELFLTDFEMAVVSAVSRLWNGEKWWPSILDTGNFQG